MTADQTDLRILAVTAMRDELIVLCTRQAEMSRREVAKLQGSRSWDGLAETVAQACEATAERCAFMARQLAELFSDLPSEEKGELT